MVSRAVNLFSQIKYKLEALGFEDVFITEQEKDALDMVIRKRKPDILLIGSGFYQCSTPFMVGQLIKTFPWLNVAAISVSNYPSELAMWFIFNGARSYVNLYEGLEEFCKGLEEVRKGHDYISPEVRECIEKRDYVPEPARKLTKTQIEIVRLICNGFTSIEISNVLHIAERSVYNRKLEIYTTLNIRNENELIRIALFLGLINIDELVFFGSDYMTKPLPSKVNNKGET